MKSTAVIAVDLGAESGRVMRADFDGASLQMTPIHRFPNIPVEVLGTLYWDALRLWDEIQYGIKAAGEAASLGLDFWGVNFALVDRDGRLLSNPVHYRDRCTEGMMEWVFERVPRRTIFERTGIQFMSMNGLYQLAYWVKTDSPILDAAATLLTVPDLYNFWLTGERVSEFTDATTMQMVNPLTGTWDTQTLTAIGARTDILPPLAHAGARIGTYNEMAVILPATHDTGSAVVAVPTVTKNYAYLSSGTWSLLGLELDHPVINDAAYEANVTNEGGVYGKTRFLKNIMGLWLAQQCRAAWLAHGQEYDYETLANLAASAPPFQSYIDPDSSEFFAPGDFPALIRAYCQRTDQPQPESVAAVMRTVYESLALKYRFVLDLLKSVSGREVEVLHVIGGGANNALLNQMTANALGIPVISGPTEATAMGNAIVQLISLGELGGVAEARQMLSHHVNTTRYEPCNVALWNAEYERFRMIIGR